MSTIWNWIEWAVAYIAHRFEMQILLSLGAGSLIVFATGIWMMFGASDTETHVISSDEDGTDESV